MSEINNFFKSKFFLSFIAGSLSALAFAPVYFFPALVISLSLFYFLLEKETKKKAIFWLGFCYGFGFFLAGNYWIAIPLFIDSGQFWWLSPFALTLLPASVSIYHASFALCYKALLKKLKFSFAHQKIIIFSTTWLTFEILRVYFLYNGFPWNLSGYSLMFSEIFIQSANIFGIYGLTFIAVLAALSPVLFFDLKKKKITLKTLHKSEIIFAVFLFSALGANFLYGFFAIDEKKIISNEAVKIRFTQDDVVPTLKWDPREKYNNLNNVINLTNSASTDDLAAVIWSETSVPYIIEKNPELLQMLKKATPENGVLITGAIRAEFLSDSKIKNVWNSVFMLDKSGVIASYDKHHLVPFGEYIPLQLEKFLPFIADIIDGGTSFSEGRGPQTIHAKGFSFSPTICYEILFPDKIIDKNDRPDLLVNITNDAWFGQSSEIYQHFDMARMRAIEHGIPLARVANGGITAFIDPFGRVVKSFNLNQEKFFDVFLLKKLEPTIYEKYSHGPLLLLLAAFSIFLIIIPQKNANRQNHAH